MIYQNMKFIEFFFLFRHNPDSVEIIATRQRLKYFV
jgi:hypothetical protein